MELYLDDFYKDNNFYKNQDLVGKRAIIINNCLVQTFCSDVDLPMLKKISIRQSYLENITFSPFLSVVILDLSQNNLTHLDKSIEKMVNLQYINLSFNKLSSIQFLEGLTKLKKIEVNYNNLAELPDFTKLVNLEYLSCYKNCVSMINSNIIFSEKLEYFNIADNNLTDIPDFLWGMKYFYNFNFTFNKILLSRLNLFKVNTVSNNLIIEQYTDPESIHNTSCQSSLRKSISKIIERVNPYDMDRTLQFIDMEKTFSIEFKNKLISNFDYRFEYDVGKVISFGELLGYIWSIIDNVKESNEVVTIYYNVVAKSLCSVSWVMNSVISLSTFVDYIHIDMDPITDLAAIIFKSKVKLEKSGKYTLEMHKNVVKKKFKKKSVSDRVINIYLETLDEC